MKNAKSRGTAATKSSPAKAKVQARVVSKPAAKGASAKPSRTSKAAASPAPAPSRRAAAKPTPRLATKTSAAKPSTPKAKAASINSPKAAPPSKAKPAPEPVVSKKAKKGSSPKQEPVLKNAPQQGNNSTVPRVAMPKPLPSPIFKATPRPEPVIAPEKDISARNKTGTVKDRIVLMVPEPYWLHCVWELSYQSVLRAESALGPDWHGCKPIIRLFDVTAQDTTSTSEATLRDIDIHGGISHWHIDIPQPPRTYRVDVGYLSKRGQFYMLARSNVVTPPIAGASEVLDDAWVNDLDKAGGAERVLAMSTGFESASGPPQLKEFFEDQFKKPPKEGSFGSGASPSKLKKFHFDLDAELVVFGRTEPSATVTLQNERVPLRPDGTFTMRFSLPDSRQIIPAVSTSADGLEEQTIVLAVERNIKRLDVMTHDMNSDL